MITMAKKPKKPRRLKKPKPGSDPYLQLPNKGAIDLWPAEIPLPAAYQKPRPMPCPRCLRMRMDLGMTVKELAQK